MMTDCDANSQYVSCRSVGELAARVDELVRHAAEPLEPFRFDETGDCDPAALLILLALRLTEDCGAEHPSSLFQPYGVITLFGG